MFIIDSGGVPSVDGREFGSAPTCIAESHMTYYTPSISTVENSSRHPSRTLTMVCLCCGDTMSHFSTILKIGVRPERLIFVCPSCKGVDNKELKRVA